MFFSQIFRILQHSHFVRTPLTVLAVLALRFLKLSNKNTQKQHGR